MTIQFSGDAATSIAMTRDILYAEGIEIATGSDFEEYHAIVESERPMQKLGAPFDPTIHNLSEQDAFWLTARNCEGELIHTQAFKSVPLKGNSLAGYLMRDFRAFPPPLPGVNEVKSRFRATPGTQRIQGTAVYHGEFWVSPEEGKYRGVGLAAVLSRTGMIDVMMRWNPDWIFGFILDVVAFKGFAARIGYMHLEPRVLRWVVEGRDNPIDTFIAYLDRYDLYYLLDIPLGEITKKAA